MTIKEECALCGRVFPISQLKRCVRCGRLFCRDCMVPDVSTGDPTKMLCLNCARKTVSPKSKTRYSALTSYLRFRAAFTDIVKLSFAQIDGVIGDNLPLKAYHDEEWWRNSRTSVHAKAWLDAGWNVQEVNLQKGYVIFRKTEEGKSRKNVRHIHKPAIKKPFTPAPYRYTRKAKPSKTKISKLYARLKNLERKRASTNFRSRSFKPRPAHEKRLFKPEEKPQ
ncbi:hypothetical protein J7L49_06600 [Candidatus Bathyarchaeota archaeon]|nr:hypothetical protein [Candidatus Bathyarchaeota archaeon]